MKYYSYIQLFIQMLETVMPLALGQGGLYVAHPEFGVTVKPIQTRGADYAHPITDSPPGFEHLTASLRDV